MPVYHKKKKPPIYDKSTGVPPTPEQNIKMLQQARNVVEYSLARSSKSYHELEIKLKEKHITDEIINILLQEYVNKGFIDDKAYAEQFVYSKTTYDKLARKAIEYKLRQKGISSDIIETVIAEIDDDEETQQAIKIAEQKLARNKHQDVNKRTQQVVGILARKGYPVSVAFQIVKTLLENEAEEN